MRLIIAPSHDVKTLEMIFTSSSIGATIVCKSKQEADRILAEAQQRDININTPIPFDELLEASLGKTRPADLAGEYIIDDIDSLIQGMVWPAEVKACSMVVQHGTADRSEMRNYFEQLETRNEDLKQQRDQAHLRRQKAMEATEEWRKKYWALRDEKEGQENTQVPKTNTQ